MAGSQRWKPVLVPHSYRIIAAVIAVVLAAGMAGCGLFGDRDGQTVGRDGGTATSNDSSLQVAFAEGQLDKKTKVAFRKDAGGPPPVPAFVPLDKPFDIHLDNASRGGTVTVKYQLPPGLAGYDQAVVMFIEEDGGWRLVPSTVDPARRTVTGQWPHFSRGWVAVFNPVIDAGDAAWSTVKAGADWTGRNIKSVATGIATGAVGVTGGTTDTARCPSSTKDWTVTNSAGMTGCVAAKSPDGSWPVNVNVRYPYPMMVTLPPGTTGPGLADLFLSYDLADLAVTMIASRYGRLIVPAGKTAPLRIIGPAAGDVHLKGVQDPFTLAIRVVALLATVASRGTTATEMAAGKAAIARTEAALENKFVDARKNGDNRYTLAEYIRDTQGDESLLRMRKDQLADARTARGVSTAYAVLDYIDCAKSAYDAHRKLKGKSTGDKVVALAKLMAGDCLPALADTLAAGVAAATSLAGVNPAEQQQRARDLAKAIVKSVKDLESVTFSTLSNVVASISFGKYDPTKASVTLTRPRTDTGLPTDMRFLVGEWGGRYRSLVVKPDGTGEMRLLNPPDDPGKPAADGNLTILRIRLEPGLAARITKSNDPTVPVGGRITIRRTGDRGVLEITTPDRTWGTATYCNSKTAADPLACG